MTDREFSKIAPSSNFTLDSFLSLLKASNDIGIKYQCTKDAIALNRIVSYGPSFYSLGAGQVGLVLSSQTAMTSTVWTDPNGIGYTITLQGDVNDLVFINTGTISGFAIVAIFQLY